jgi:cytosine/adenosine deaminase-related metal-dependent hydrolase
VILAADWVVPMDGPPIRDGVVEVLDGRIAAVGPADGTEDARHPDSVILPGLVNAHTHLEYAAMAGFGDGLPFTPWIADHIRRKDTQTVADLLDQARAGAAASLAGGVTTVADCCYAGTVAQAADEAGLRAIVYVEGFSVWEGLEERIGAAIDALPTSELVSAGVSPHAPYTVTHEDYAMLVALARGRGLPVATHLLESDRETEHLDAFADVLGPDTVAIHAVRVNEADIALLAERDVPVAHCPRSNAMLGCGIAPLNDLLDAGVRVGLGTDSPSSALDFDMWAEMRTAIMLARARTARADALSAATALELATTRAATAIGLDAEVGSLTPGKAADLVVLDLAGSPFLPWDDPVTAAVYGGSPARVALTMVAGEIRYRRGERHDSGASAARAKMIQAPLQG